MAYKSAKVFEKSAVEEIFGDDLELIQTAVEAFIADLPTQISSLKEAVSKKSQADLKSVSHTIKGASSYAGAMRINKLAEECESLAGTGKVDECIALCGVFEEESTKFQTEMKAYSWK
eukprot:Nk52_evm21s343 gene=Nk52_evmTU21s343